MATSLVIARPRRRKIAEWKLREVEELVKLIKKHRTIVIADLSKVPAAQLHRIRRRIKEIFGNKVELRVTKNTLFRIALEKAGIDPKPLEDYLTGTNLFIFSDIQAFKLALELDKIVEYAPAKPGDIAPTDIVLPPMDTGIKPGPMMSMFGKLRIPIRVQGGTIWIAKEVRVAKQGDVISPELASILQKLGIEPIEVKLKLKCAYEDGVLIPGDQLKLDLEEYKKMTAEAHLHAVWVGAEIAYPVPEVLELSLKLAARRAWHLAAEAGYITPENAEYVLALAIAKAQAVVAALGDKAKEIGIEVSVAAAAPKPAEEEKKEEEKPSEEEKEETVSEEQIAAGLEGLFGGF